MGRVGLALLLSVLLLACVGDSSNTPDGGNGNDAGKDASTTDGGVGTCVFGTSHFADGCKFGP